MTSWRVLPRRVCARAYLNVKTRLGTGPLISCMEPQRPHPSRRFWLDWERRAVECHGRDGPTTRRPHGSMARNRLFPADARVVRDDRVLSRLDGAVRVCRADPLLVHRDRRLLAAAAALRLHPAQGEG